MEGVFTYYGGFSPLGMATSHCVCVCACVFSMFVASGVIKLEVLLGGLILL